MQELRWLICRTVFFFRAVRSAVSCDGRCFVLHLEHEMVSVREKKSACRCVRRTCEVPNGGAHVSAFTAQS